VGIAIVIQSKHCPDERLRAELTLEGPLGWGPSAGALLTQELLRLHGINVIIDGNLGPATALGLAQFCVDNGGFSKDDFVTQVLIDELAQPLLRVAEPASKAGGLSETVAATAKRHLIEHPIEIGGANRGPWVRLYMNGSEGANFPWCAGFVTYIVRQAAEAHSIDAPIKRTFSCDHIGAEAKSKAKSFFPRASLTHVPPGSIFLVPHSANNNDWIHTGIVLDSDFLNSPNVLHTIEGNTNDDGSREGFEVCQRYRSYDKVDIVII
jgi:hypothetical protein